MGAQSADSRAARLRSEIRFPAGSAPKARRDLGWSLRGARTRTIDCSVADGVAEVQNTGLQAVGSELGSHFQDVAIVVVLLELGAGGLVDR